MEWCRLAERRGSSVASCQPDLFISSEYTWGSFIRADRDGPQNILKPGPDDGCFGEYWGHRLSPVQFFILFIKRCCDGSFTQFRSMLGVRLRGRQCWFSQVICRFWLRVKNVHHIYCLSSGLSAALIPRGWTLMTLVDEHEFSQKDQYTGLILVPRVSTGATIRPNLQLYRHTTLFLFFGASYSRFSSLTIRPVLPFKLF